ncbi:rare lipoprotein A [Deferribacter desulfuricans SSM1]|uniref:Probable endolytic peptidoglycan transglycosylase RlpA n=1 Tax=Deferribacter desulfuricans (strain DSM 14783 / JCM 11476 / NBRC 101012 / SSM1) TaxID=639282 RepID=D3P9Z0_DEFDS|nr:septal ring lytic transglycosylase RlpA family protein [Deferribacter desulfuricans]BAI81530.1 rare lipoprotein A [Deferribacter desulfuricans SSM1]
MLKKYYNLFLITLVLLTVSCATKYHPPKYKAKGVRYGKPYVIRGKLYYPYTKISHFQQVGIASWYGKEEHGKLTASGERFNMYDLTAAHKLLPLGSYVHVKNLENGKEVDVRINDRGPFISGRIIDLSYAAAKKIGIVEKGTAKVKITLLSESPDFYQVKGERYNLDKGNFAIQIGSFKVYNNAYKLSKQFRNSRIEKAYIHGNTFYRVQITGFNSLEKAQKGLNDIKYRFPGAFIVSLD